MRGTRVRSKGLRRMTGIIPAYAGNTNCVSAFIYANVDHPRVCGEHQPGTYAGDGPQGSSPRMRGTLVYRNFQTVGHGIIPAYAGNTAGSLQTAEKRRDHPRVCGEHKTSACLCALGMGSSPRMRGTRRSRRPRRPRSGIIPAYAGNTISSKASWTARRDHPRVCGEHTRSADLDSLPEGSSPRMRGTLCEFGGDCRNRGIIPAYAGNTRKNTA